MKAQTISFEFPKEILLAINENENNFKNRVKLNLAIELFQNQKLTLGKAAQFAGLSRFEFETKLALKNISISSLELEDILKDIKELEKDEN